MHTDKTWKQMMYISWIFTKSVLGMGKYKKSGFDQESESF